MTIYKVIFENNRAVAADLVERTNAYELVKVDNSNRSVEWLVLSGADEHDAIQIANGIAKDYAGSHWPKRSAAYSLQ